MSEPLRVDLETRNAQARATHPGRSAWVSANAGSGKTYVLARRVMRLLLAGNAPDKILCLTYTKAAAAEMSNRIFSQLAQWAVMADDALATELAGILDTTPSAKQRAKARTLFAAALDTPGGLKIQTIHAFCEAVLHQFPLEANVPGHFEVMDDQQQRELLAEARRRAFADAEADASLGNHAQALFEHADDAAISSALDAIVGDREAFNDLYDIDYEARIGAMFTAFGLGLDETAEILATRLIAETGIPENEMLELAAASLNSGKQTGIELANCIDAYVKATGPVDKLNAYFAIFLTGKNEARSPNRFLLAQVKKEYPAAAEQMVGEIDRAAHAFRRMADLEMLDRTRSLIVFARVMLQHYHSLKRARGKADFDDLVTQTARLLGRTDVRDWVLYKLDRGIDHVLVDEAQDTSERQWEIISALVEDFHSGNTASQKLRTMFAVGDEKQSIYSFQGARPELFHAKKEALKQAVESVQQQFEAVPLHLSFRSTQEVLAAVDAVFEAPENREGLSADGNKPLHEANRLSEPGEVQVWPYLKDVKSDPPEDWMEPLDRSPPAALRLARKIAGVIAEWLNDPYRLVGREGRRLRAGDVLVLVRKRGAFVNELIRELKAHNLPVAGADRLVLTQHIAIADLIALARFVLQQADDLSLAGVLKSPLFGFTDEDLVEVTAGRDATTSLWDHLSGDGNGASTTETLARRTAATIAQLQDWIALSRQVAPAGFFAHVLGADGGRKAIHARLGDEATEILDAFEEFVAARDGQSADGLHGLISALESAPPQIKREADAKRNEIRVMTVHAAKGLEAPAVFLVDAGGRLYNSNQETPVFHVHEPVEAFLWHRSARDSLGVLERHRDGLKRAAAQEYRRLLYVGMTRAADILVVCGHHGVRPPDPMCWNAMVSAALFPGNAFVEEEMHVWRKGEQRPAGPAGQKQEPLAEAIEPLPASLLGKAAREIMPARPLNPSHAAQALGRQSAYRRSNFGIAPSGGIAAQGVPDQRLFGVAVHKLLHLLPQIDPASRPAAAAGWLERQYPQWPHYLLDRARLHALNVLALPALSPIFGPQSAGEVAVAGSTLINGIPAPISGVIDRLAIEPQTVWIADFKTDRMPPEVAPPAYLLQMALYRDLLRQIHPDKTVRCLLVWTVSGGVHELRDDAMDDVLAEFATT